MIHRHPGFIELASAVFILLLILMTSAICQQTADSWVDKGAALDNRGNYDEAVRYYYEAIRLDPTLAAAWYTKGMGLEALGRNAEADAAFAKARELGATGPAS